VTMSRLNVEKLLEVESCHQSNRSWSADLSWLTIMKHRARTRIATTSCVHRSHGGRCSQHSRHTLTSVAQLPQEPTRRAAGFDNGFIKISPHTLVSVDTIVQ